MVAGTGEGEAGAFERSSKDESQAWLAPEGYAVTLLDGVVRTGQSAVVICTAPIRISEVGTDPYGNAFLTLTWLYHGEEVSFTAPRAEIFTKDALSRMTAKGAPITQANRAAVQNYLQLQESTYWPDLPKVPVRTEGWSKEFEAYTIGNTIIGEEGRLYQTAEEAFVNALGQRGLESQHKAVTERARDSGSVAELCWAAGFAAPLLRPLQLRSTVFSIWGPSGSGKSALQALAASAWGRPDDLKHTGDISPRALEIVMATRNDFLLWVDDTQQTTQQQLLDNLFYSVASGTSATRATAEGALRANRTWRSLVLVSGERPVLPEGAAAGSQRRGIELEVAPMGEFEARAIHTQLAMNHGWTGPAFMKEFQRTFVGHFDRLQKLYYALEEEIAKQDRSAWSNQVSLLALADLLARMFVCGESEARAEEAALEAGVAVLQRTVEAVAETKTTFDMAKGALKDFVAQYESTFKDDHKVFIAPMCRGKFLAIDGKSCVGMFSTVFKQFCDEHNLNQRQFLSEARAKGFLLPNGQKQFQRVISLDQKPKKAYVFDLSEEEVEEDL